MLFIGGEPCILALLFLVAVAGATPRGERWAAAGLLQTLRLLAWLLPALAIMAAAVTPAILDCLRALFPQSPLGALIAARG